MQLNEIEYLNMQIAHIAESDAFKDVESKTRFDDIIADNYEQQLNVALENLIAKNIAELNS